MGTSAEINSTISVCMATYNGEAYIRQQLESILKQVAPDDEIIVSDDSSTDNTIQIIEDVNDRRIRLYKGQRFKSPVFNLENALKHARGTYIFLADQDDIWESQKIDVMMRYLTYFDLVISDARIIDEDDQLIHPSFYEINGSKKGLIRNIFKNSFLGCSIAFNRKILKKSLPFPKDTPMHDWWIGLTAELYGKTYFCKDKLVRYRRHGKNMSYLAKASGYSLWQKIRFRYVIIKCLLFRLIKLNN